MLLVCVGTGDFFPEFFEIRITTRDRAVLFEFDIADTSLIAAIIFK